MEYGIGDHSFDMFVTQTEPMDLRTDNVDAAGEHTAQAPPLDRPRTFDTTSRGDNRLLQPGHPIRPRYIINKNASFMRDPLRKVDATDPPTNEPAAASQVEHPPSHTQGGPTTTTELPEQLQEVDVVPENTNAKVVDGPGVPAHDATEVSTVIEPTDPEQAEPNRKASQEELPITKYVFEANSGDRALTTDEWEARLEAFCQETGMELKGNTNLLAQAVAELDKGVQFIYKTLGSRINNQGMTVERPTLSFIAQPIPGLEDDTHVAATLPRNIVINLNAPHLNHLLGIRSGTALGNLYLVKHLDGESYHVPMAEHLFADGVEEGHHGLAIQLRGLDKGTKQGVGHTHGPGAYYAQNDFEFQAARWRYTAARMCSMSLDMQLWQQAVYNEAKRIRASHAAAGV